MASAMASASEVLPFPGGPESRTRWRGCIPCARSKSARRCSSMSWRESCSAGSVRIRLSSVARGSDSITKSRPAAPTRRNSLEGVMGTDCSALLSRSARTLWLFARSSATIASTVETKLDRSPEAPALTKETRRSLLAIDPEHQPFRPSRRG